MSHKGQTEVFFIAAVALFTVVGLIFAMNVMRISGQQIKNKIEVTMKLTDAGRKLVVLLTSEKGGSSNMETAGSMIAVNHPDSSPGLEESYRVLEGKYLRVGTDDIYGKEPDSGKVFTAEIPLPGGKESPAGIKTEVGFS